MLVFGYALTRIARIAARSARIAAINTFATLTRQ
jgi:hypothetical protein